MMSDVPAVDSLPLTSTTNSAAVDAGNPWRRRLIGGLILAAYLTPIWAFRHFPTLDGPSHLSNALILNEYGRPGTRYAEFYVLRRTPLPNWTSHAVLAALLRVCPPLVAEKLFVTGMVAGFALGLRYFLGAFARDVGFLWPAGLLLAYNRCLLFGFYNYYISIVFLFVVLGYVARRGSRPTWRECAILLLLLTLQYFTHLLGFALSIGCAACLIVAGGKGRVRRLIQLAIAALPGVCLAIAFLVGTGTFAHANVAPVDELIDVPQSDPISALLTFFARWDGQIFDPYALHDVSIGPFVLIFGQALLIATLFTPSAAPDAGRSSRRTLAMLGLMLAWAFAIVPDHVTRNGNFFWARLAPLPPLLWLACGRLPTRTVARRGFELALSGLLAANLAMVLAHFHKAERKVSEFTAAVDAVGCGKTITTLWGSVDPSLHTDPLRHAVDYYCTRCGNINMDNYEARTDHFPVAYHPELLQEDGLVARRVRLSADVILLWGNASPPQGEQSGHYQEVYHRGRLRVLKRLPSTEGREASDR